MRKVATPGCTRCPDVAAYLGVPIEQTVKAVVVAVDPPQGSAGPAEIWMLLVRGDHDLNETKVGKQPDLARWRLASEAEIEAHFGCPPGYLGPVAPRRPVRVIADRTVARMSDFVCGANEADYHLVGVNWGRDLPEPDRVADLRNVLAGDPSPDGKGRLQIQRGIEVGHVFFLGTLYSEKLGATYLDESGQPHPIQMGCYGIGVTRLLGAAIEQNHDERGIIWPDAIAPFEVVICPINYQQSAPVREQADRLYQQLCEIGVEALLDDRGERPGAMFADAELIGIPHRVTVGERGLKANQLEYASRRSLAASMVPTPDVVAFIREQIRR
jgi:prolyl-tRNA synthetase